MNSDDSDFYGDDELVSDLKTRVHALDVETWWEDHEYHEAASRPLTIQARKQEAAAADEAPRFHNPYAGMAYAWQLTETVDDFLDRVPPATTSAIGGPWIWICNPYIERKSKKEAANQYIRGCEDEVPEDDGADLKTLMNAGMERLHIARSFIDKWKNSGESQNIIARESGKAGRAAAKDILQLADQLSVKCGKWMLFCSVIEVNEVWEIVAKATAKNELGIAAKVASRLLEDERTERLICVYTADFTDTKDVKRVAERLKQLGLVKPRGKPLYYKPDAYTYLGISSGNAFMVKASIYDTTSMLGK
ncbi:DUF1917-domain-containing protein [Xylariomycetidae sp. FL2044]|nr:DUF1917-domain-containing protein [Xylariomycetidae sp. FL2044]